MNKILTFLFAAMLVTACSNNDDNVPSEPVNVKGLSFELKTVNKMEAGMRAGAPIYSQEATQNVTRVNVYAFKSNGTNYLFVKTFNVTGWTLGTTTKVYDVPEADKLAAGSYKFLAVGQDASDNYTITSPDATTKLEDMTASISALGDEYEIFAGVAQAEVTTAGARVSVSMTRKVAGVLGYFKNIPQTLDTKTVKYLRLGVSATNMAVNLSTSVGASPSTSYNIIDMNLSGQTVLNGYYTGNDLSGSGVVKVANSQLAGKYLLPVPGVTMTLGLYDESETAIKTWTVLSGGSSSFDIIANNFYSLGMKAEAGSTGSGGPTPDNPIDLSVDDEITITIIPAWDLINYLSIQ